jgi:site-specific DNA-methyltransferase (adenine-specific)
MIPTLTIGDATIYQGNNLEILPTLADNSVDSIVCDPPYELGFMGKSWDSSGIAYSVELWQECLRVLKPGGHLLAFGGTRTWHRLAVAIEDAGFEIRDNIAWLYGSGFPKSHNISKAIDKAAGAERTIIGRNPNSRENATKDNTLYESGTVGKTDFITEATTDEAKAWDGWGTALKPAHEPIVVARKAVEGTVANNVLTYGVGALNIDGTRVGTEVMGGQTVVSSLGRRTNEGGKHSDFVANISQGRWPANIILDEFTAELLDQQSGISKSKPSQKKDTTHAEEIYGKGLGNWSGSSHNDAGGASRFFYVAKANKRDRNEGLDELPIQRPDLRTATGMGTFEEKGVQPQRNFHPTVKPTALMQYLIRLVTPSNGVVLDPFAGSGSTGKAAILENKRFIGIELTADYLPIIEGRLQHAVETMNTQGDDLFE